MSSLESTSQNLPFILQPIGKVMVVEFREPSLMDPIVLKRCEERLYALIDAEDRRKIVLDFGRVQYLSSQAIGMLLTMKKKLDKLGSSDFILCGVGDRLQELLKITRLDRVLTVKPTQREAIANIAGA